MTFRFITTVTAHQVGLFATQIGFTCHYIHACHNFLIPWCNVHMYACDLSPRA